MYILGSKCTMLNININFVWKCIIQLCSSGCLDSDGLVDFEWSHNGFFYNSKQQGVMDNVGECMNACKENINCVGLHYRHKDSRMCYVYDDRNDFVTKIYEDEIKAYIRCQGIM